MIGLFPWLGLSLLTLFGVGVGCHPLPDVSSLAWENPQKTSFMRYREEHGIYGEPIWVPLVEISPALRHAVIVAEDAHFYDHQGADWKAIWDALKEDWRAKRLYRGGSTITQQLAKNLYLHPSKTIWRKTREMLIAFKIERTIPKSRILEIYLNVVEWGRGIYGAEAAAQHYFDKPASDLTLEEASWLAAILPAPLRYEKERDSEYLKNRSKRIASEVQQQFGTP